MSIADTIRAAREDAGHTQASLAEALGVTEHTIYEWERGTYAPRDEHRARLRAILGLDLGLRDTRVGPTAVWPADTPIGEQIQTARIQAGLTQAELADAIGCSDRTISAWERGDRTPSRRLRDALASALNIHLDGLET